MSKVKAKSHKASGTGTGSGRMEARREQMAQAIALWARHELHLRERSIPAPEELKL